MIRLCGQAAAIPPGTPGHPCASGGDAEPRGQSQDRRDPRVILQQAPPGEDRVPIVVSAAHQRQFQRPGVGQVAGDIKPVLEEPNAGGGKAERLAFPPEGDRQHTGKHQLAKGAVALNPQPSALNLPRRVVPCVRMEQETRQTNSLLHSFPLHCALPSEPDRQLSRADGAGRTLSLAEPATLDLLALNL